MVEFVAALGHLAALDVLVMMTVGVAAGLVIGVVPGLGGLATLALLLPFTYGLDTFPALGLVLGAYSALYFGGSITAILFNTPGTGEQVVTTFDGYPMTRRGEGARALGASATASALGGLVGAALLIVAAPVFKQIIVLVRPPEMFALALLGVAAIGVVSASSVTKGLISGLVGLVLSFVGYDPITGVPRFTGGALTLFDGLGITAMTLGLFAVAEMIFLYARGRSIAERGAEGAAAASGAGVFTGIRDALRNLRTVAEGGLIGAFTGMLPGMGGTVAMVFSYARARQRAPDPSRFGTGEVVGVIAPEAANNAKEGGSFVPTVAFGIPGSSGMAIFIGIFLILGIEPGPKMLTTQLDVTYFVALAIAATSVVASVVGLASATVIARAAYLPVAVLAPVLMAVAFLGAYLDTQTLTTLAVVAVAGVVGFWLRVTGYSCAGVILGFVMGPLVEKYLFLSLQAYGGGFVARPLVLAIAAVSLVIVLGPYIRRARRRRAAAREEARP
ncbi:MAG: tripartite tricarboxylate transporter permease [Azospirillaceae bacterium]